MFALEPTDATSPCKDTTCFSVAMNGVFHGRVWRNGSLQNFSRNIINSLILSSRHNIRRVKYVYTFSLNK